MLVDPHSLFFYVFKMILRQFYFQFSPLKDQKYLEKFQFRFGEGGWGHKGKKVSHMHFGKLQKTYRK